MHPTGCFLFSCTKDGLTMFYSESSILLATIGLVGVIGSAVILTYGFVRAPRVY